MKVSENITIFAGMDTQNTKNAEEQSEQKKKTVFAGQLNENTLQNRILQKKQEAQKQAMKIVGDVWKNEQKIDDDMRERREHVKTLRQENKEANASIKEIKDRQAELQEEYGVADDSKEQQDLELLRRKRDMMSGKGGGLTQEEFMYAAKLEAEGLTEYQQRQLDYDDLKSYYEKIVDENDKMIKQENAIIRATSLERLKKDPMVDAQKQAEEIKKAASEDIIGMVVEDAKDHIDEKQEEREEQAETLKEEREEREKLLEAQKEKREEQEALLEDIPTEEIISLDQIKADVQREIQDIMNKMKLVAEDIKGAAVDQNV